MHLSAFLVHASLLIVLVQQAPPAPGATINGRVFDPDGRAMANVTVVPLVAGDDQDILAGKPGQSGVDGRFTITGVPPTTIVLRALPATASKRRHPAVFFPGVLDRKEAWEIDVKPGETIELDIHVPPVFVASIKTVVSGPDGYVLDQVRVMRPASNAIRNVRVTEDLVGDHRSTGCASLLYGPRPALISTRWRSITRPSIPTVRSRSRVYSAPECSG